MKVSPRMEIPRLFLSDLVKMIFVHPPSIPCVKLQIKGAQWKGEAMTKSFAEDNCYSSLGRRMAISNSIRLEA